MTSSEIVDSGRFSRHKSNFSQTCSLLSRYIKEKGSFGDLSLGLNRNFDSNGAPAKTMNLLSMIEKPGQNSDDPAKPVNLIPQSAGFYSIPENKTDISVAKSEPDTAQMTIFYGGQVLVFNDFPAEKAKEIMLLANKGSPLIDNAFTPTNIIQKSADSATSYGNGLVQQENLQSPLYPRINDLPLSRKASLTRFLEKRKDRIIAKAPYQTSNSVSKAGEKGKPWMVFGAEFPFEDQYV